MSQSEKFDPVEWAKKTYKERTEAGFCAAKGCSGLASSISVYCMACLNKQRARQKRCAEEKAAAKQAEQAAKKHARKKAGLCLDCGGKRHFKLRCRRCKAALLEKKGCTRYDARKHVGLCQNCNKLTDGDAVRCTKHATQRQKGYAEEKWLYICTQCKGPNTNPDSDRVCLKCIERERANYAARIGSRVEADLCTGCGKNPTENGDARCTRCITRDRVKDRKKYKKLRDQVVEAYGGVCQCPGCKQTRHEFLHVDHINNDGAAHRKELGGAGATRMYTWLRKNNFPKEGFQLLCANCNFSKGHHGGKCPYAGTTH